MDVQAADKANRNHYELVDADVSLSTGLVMLLFGCRQVIDEPTVNKVAESGVNALRSCYIQELGSDCPERRESLVVLAS